MTTQLKNTGKAAAFFLQHGEKLGMVLVVGLVGWLVYAATGQVAEEKQPGDLSQLVTQTRGKIEGTTWAYAKENADPPPPTAESFQAAVNEAIDPGLYVTSRRGVNPPVVPPVVFRKDPVLLTATAAEGHGYTALIGFFSDAVEKQRELERRAEEQRRELEQQRKQAQKDRDAERGDFRLGRGDDPNVRRAGGRRRRGGLDLDGGELINVQSCVVVTAKVPSKDQFRIYQDTFENALGYDPELDVPQYLGYFVERAEVRGSTVGEFRPLKFRNGLGGSPLAVVSEKTIPAAVADWADEMEEIADVMYTHPALTFPLPARVDSDWGPEVVHSEVPLQTETDALEAARDEAEEDETYDPSEEGDEPSFGFGDARSPRGRRGEGGRRSFSGRRTRGGGSGEEFDGEGGVGRRSRRGRSGSETQFETPHLMLRFIDFSVDQGRRYRYRFQLVLVDANGKGQTAGKNLEKEVKERVGKTKPKPGAIPFLRTEWSEPTADISVPLAGGVRLANVQQPTTSGEPTASLVVNSFGLDENDRAVTASIEKDKVRLGTVMNFTERNAEVVKGSDIHQVEGFDFRTGMTLLDVAGGGKLTKQMNSPGEMLVMDPTGRLSVRSEIRDYADVELHRLTYAEDENGSRGGGGGGGGGDYGGFEEEFF